LVQYAEIVDLVKLRLAALRTVHVNDV